MAEESNTFLRSDFKLNEKDQQEEEKQQTVIDNLGSMLFGRFQEWYNARLDKEEEWLEDLRAYNGFYETSEKQKIEPNQSDVYVHLTRTKAKSAYARIVDLLYQNADKHWALKSTPVPEMERGTSITDPVTGQQLELTAEDVVKVADKLASNMEKEMADQLLEADYDTLSKQAILECCILGTGAMKGVTVKTAFKEKWIATEDGGWDIEMVEQPAPDISNPSIFDLYPDPYALSTKGAVGIFEHHVLTRTQLLDLAKNPGFDKEIIERIILDFPQGNHTETQHEIELRNIANFSTIVGSSRRYDIYEYWGDVGGEDLRTAGLEIDNESAQYQANVWICAGRTLMARLNPNKPQKIPYHIFPLERVPHQFWGVGIPRMMRDSQETINSATRNLIDNAAWSAGPQYEVNMDLLADGEDPRNLKRWKAWLRDGGDPQYPLLRFYTIPNNTKQLLEVIDLFRKFADEETSMPSYTHGEVIPGLNKTASGMSMLMGAANVSLKAIIKNIDDYMIESFMRSLYDWNMMWNDKEDIKGDMQIDARGSTALVAKEIQGQRLMQFLSMTANPLDAPLTERSIMLRKTAAALDIDAEEVVKTEEELTAGGGGEILPNANQIQPSPPNGQVSGAPPVV